MTSIKRLIPALILTALALSGCGDSWTPREGEYQWERDFFGAETYAELREEASEEDRKALQNVMELAEEAFSAFPNGEEEAAKKYGKLYRYTNYDAPEGSTETHDLKFLTGKTEGNSGYLWVNYSKAVKFGSETISGSWDINSRWTVEKQNGEWVVTEIKEAA